MLETRQHSSRMHTIRFATCQYRLGMRGSRSQVNKTEQVSIDDHQYPEGVPYHMTYPMMHVMLPNPPDRMTDRHLRKHYLPSFVGGK